MDYLQQYCHLGDDTQFNSGVSYLYGIHFIESADINNLTKEQIVHFIAIQIKKALNKSKEYNKTQIVFCVDLDGALIKHFKIPLITLMAQLLQAMFPDSLYQCYIYNTPFIFSQFYDLLSRIIDKVTRSKIFIYRKNRTVSGGLSLIHSQDKLSESLV